MNCMAKLQRNDYIVICSFLFLFDFLIHSTYLNDERKLFVFIGIL